MKTKSCWVSCKIFTVQLEIDEDEVIYEAAPIVKKFIGQRLINLTGWAHQRGGGRCRIETLPLPKPYVWKKIQ